MSLNWNIEECSEEIRNDEGEWPITNALIWATMGVGLGEITEKNAAEFYARVKLSEKLVGQMLNRGPEPYWITAEDVRKRVGLRTNVSNEGRAKWVNRFVKHDLDACVRQYEQEAAAVA
jgi:hypothetical protein